MELLRLHDKVINLLKYQDNRSATDVMYVVVLHMEIILWENSYFFC